LSQQNVEMVIGRLVTDEGFRRRFTTDAAALVEGLVGEGLHLNPCEQRALAALDPREVARFAEALNPCIQKVELRRERF
jgi:hypothetical protein